MAFGSGFDDDADTVIDAQSVDRARPPAPKPGAPRLLSPDDKVPALRQELRLRRRDNTGFEVFDPNGGSTYPLNEYEVSLVRMLNGKRPVTDILQASARLGIPINLESLQGFIQHLHDSGLLASETGETAANQTWASRGQWESSVRTMFQSGIRLLRLGKHEEAAGYFEALLQEDPDNIEASELLALARQGPTPDPLGGGTMLGVVPPAPHTSAPAPHMLPFMSVVHAPAPAYAPAPLQPSLPPWPGPTPTISPASIAAMALASPQQRSRRSWLPIGGIVLAVAIGVGVWQGVAHTAAEPSESAPNVTTATVTTAVTVPATVTTAVAVPATNTPPVQARVEPAAPGEAEPSALAKSESTTPVKPEPAAPAQVTAEPAAPPPELAKPAPLVAHVSASASGQVTAFLRARRAVTKGEVLFQIVRAVGDPSQISAFSAKVDELTKLAARDPMYEPFLASAKDKLAGARRVVSTSISAPRAGDATPHVHQGQMVSAGQLLADVAYVASAPAPSARKK